MSPNKDEVWKVPSSRLGAALLVFAAFFTACRGCGPDSEKPVPSTFERSLPAPVYVNRDLHTTDPGVAMANLEAEIRDARDHVKSQPHDFTAKASLVTLLLTHARIVGSPVELAEAVKIGDDALADAPDDLDALLLHVEVRGAAHRYEEALAELDAVEAHHKDKLHLEKREGQTRMARARLLIAMGRYEDAKKLVDVAVALNPDTENLGTLAVLLALMGMPQEAEARFTLAESSYRDASPFPIADLYFERASMWERAGELPKATSIFQAAHEHLPQHAHVATHLAALIPPGDAVKILAPVAAASTDPEVWGALGVYENFVQDKSGDADLERAKAGYDELMKTMPAAYADHAGWFWLNVARDPEKAFAAASKNLEARQNADAFELSIASARAAGKKSDACAVAQRAKTFPYPTQRLSEELRVVGDCSSSDRRP